MATSYVVCSRALARARTEFGAAECHGLLCGMLCGVEEQAPQRWLEEVLGPGERVQKAKDECRDELLRVLTETVRTLWSGRCNFAPLLPDDNAGLGVRSKALAAWCSGFLYGIGSAGDDFEARLSKDAQEVLSDFSEVTRLRSDAKESESSEADYSEIVEYMRVGVMLIFEELQGGPQPGDTVHRLH
jgi:yecA family protein